MKVLIELSKEELKKLNNAIGCDTEDEDDVEYAIHTLIKEGI